MAEVIDLVVWRLERLLRLDRDAPEPWDDLDERVLRRLRESVRAEEERAPDAG